MARPGRSRPAAAYLILQRLAPMPPTVPGTLTSATAALGTLTATSGTGA